MPITGLKITLTFTLGQWTGHRRFWTLDRPDEHGCTEHPAAIVFQDVAERYHWRACKPYCGGLHGPHVKTGYGETLADAQAQADEWLATQ